GGESCARRASDRAAPSVEDRQEVPLLRALFLANDCRVGNPIGATPLRRKLTAHRTEDRLDPLVLIGVKEPALDRVDVMRSRWRFRRAAAFLYHICSTGFQVENGASCR